MTRDIVLREGKSTQFLFDFVGQRQSFTKGFSNLFVKLPYINLHDQQQEERPKARRKKDLVWVSFTTIWYINLLQTSWSEAWHEKI